MSDKAVKIERLSRESFLPYGEFYDVRNWSATPVRKPGDPLGPNELLFAGGPEIRVSFEQIRYEDPFIKGVLSHHTGQVGIWPISASVLLPVAAKAGEGGLWRTMRVFLIPRGTFVLIRPHIWFSNPLATSGREIAIVQIIQPENSNGRFSVQFDQGSWVEINMSSGNG